MDSKCPDCGVSVGNIHQDGCDIERCPDCGYQAISCSCEGEYYKNPRIAWSGKFPGVEECREFGWYSKLVQGKGWQSCTKNDPEATEDLNRLHCEAVWSASEAKFVLSD